jgi:hypothetical protein
MDDHRLDALRYATFFDRFRRTHRELRRFRNLAPTMEWGVPMGERQAIAYSRAFPREGKETMIRDVEIHAVVNGFIVKVGCQRLAFNDLDYMLQELKLYILQPEATEKRYMNESINSAGMASPDGIAEAQGEGRSRADLVGVPREERIDFAGGDDHPERPRPVWERIVERLDLLEDRIGERFTAQSARMDHIDRDFDTRVDAASQRLDRLDEIAEDHTGYIHVQAGQDQEFSDRITELEAEVPRWQRVVSESGAREASP